MSKDYTQFPMTLKIITNKTMSVVLSGKAWVIDPTFDLNTDGTDTVLDVLQNVATTVAQNITSYAPRFNTGGFEHAVADVKDHLTKIELVMSYLKDYEVTRHKLDQQEALNDTLAKIHRVGVSLEITNTEEGFDIPDRHAFVQLAINFPGVKYLVTRHYAPMEKFFTPIYLNLVATGVGGIKKYWDVRNKAWVDTYTPTAGFNAYVSITATSLRGRKELTVYDLINSISNYVVDTEYLPKTVPVKEGLEVEVGKVASVVSFTKIDAELYNLAINNLQSISLGVNCDWQDFEFANITLSWHVAYPKQANVVFKETSQLTLL